MDTMEINNRVDVLNAIPEMLGFTPEESVVIISHGRGPHARLDMPHNPAEREQLRSALAPGVTRHWAHSLGVLVILYTQDAPSAMSFFLDFQSYLPGVVVADAFRYHNGLIYDPELLEGVWAHGVKENPKRREDLEALAAKCTTVAQAEEEALGAWSSGDGALGWTYLDQAEKLGELSLMGQFVKHALTQAIDPRGINKEGN